MKWEIMKCPDCGEEPNGLLETVRCQAFLKPDGKGGFEYAGETDVWWNDQKAVRTVEGKETLICPRGHEWQTKRIKEPRNAG